MLKGKNEVHTCIPEDYSELGKNILILLIPALYVYSILLINRAYLGVIDKHQLEAWIAAITFVVGTTLFFSYRRQHRLLNILAITERGLSIGRMEDSSQAADYLVSWKEIESVEELGKADKGGHFKQNLVINSSLKASFKLTSANAFRWITREDLIAALIKFAPQAKLNLTLPNDSETSHLLRYTNLWLENLDTTGKRTRSGILDGGDILAQGQYKIIRQIGAGGQGRAYLALDLNLEQEVILKEYILPTQVESKDLEAVHKSEAAILARLKHSGVVKLLDCFEEDYRGYLVLELVKGVPIHDLISRQGALREAEVKAIAISLCQTVAYLHSFSPPIIHGDLTPENIILREDGTVCLIDFTIAHYFSKVRKLKVCGKDGYVAPEQYAGYDSPQSDVYSIGCTLYFMLSSRDCEIMTQPDFYPEPVSEAMKAIVAKATAQEADDRYIDCVAMQADLAHLPK